MALFLASRRTAVNRHPALWSPDFPLPALNRAGSDCLADSRANFSTHPRANRAAAVNYIKRQATVPPARNGTSVSL